jgi:hypothetical protein
MARHPRHPRPEGRDDARAREKGGASIAANTTLAASIAANTTLALKKKKPKTLDAFG